MKIFRKLLSVFLVLILSMTMLPFTAFAAYETPRYILSYVSNNSASDVRTLQQALNAVIGASLSVDGDFGIKTHRAVCQYQQSRGLEVDGEVGSITWIFLMGEYQAKQNLQTGTNYLIGQAGTNNGVLDVPSENVNANGARIQIWSYVQGNQNQLFYLQRNSDGSYRIYSKASGKALEVRDSSKASGAQVAQWNYVDGYPCKDWFIRYDSNTNAYEIINKNSLLALDLTGGTLQLGNTYQQYARNNTSSQRFWFKTPSNMNTTTSTATSSKASGYNVNAALQFAKQNVHTHTEWLCAEYVSRCLNAGNINIFDAGVGGLYRKLEASNFGSFSRLNVEANGKALPGKNKQVTPGDVVIMYCPACKNVDGKPYLHTVLVSDVNTSSGIRVYAHNNPQNNTIYNGFNHCGFYGHGRNSGVIAYVYHFK